MHTLHHLAPSYKFLAREPKPPINPTRHSTGASKGTSKPPQRHDTISETMFIKVGSAAPHSNHQKDYNSYNIHSHTVPSIDVTSHPDMSPILLTILGGLAALYILLRSLLTFTQDAREPPVLETTIPFVSPIIGMRKKARFYIDLRHVPIPNPLSSLYL